VPKTFTEHDRVDVTAFGDSHRHYRYHSGRTHYIVEVAMSTLYNSREAYEALYAAYGGHREVEYLGKKCHIERVVNTHGMMLQLELVEVLDMRDTMGDRPWEL
jgi:hypothetical protein